MIMRVKINAADNSTLWAVIRSRRLSKRSAATPPKIPNSRNGVLRKTLTSPRASAEELMIHTSQLRAMASIHMAAV